MKKTSVSTKKNNFFDLVTLILALGFDLPVSPVEKVMTPYAIAELLIFSSCCTDTFYPKEEVSITYLEEIRHFVSAEVALKLEAVFATNY